MRMVANWYKIRAAIHSLAVTTLLLFGVSPTWAQISTVTAASPIGIRFGLSPTPPCKAGQASTAPSPPPSVHRSTFGGVIGLLPPPISRAPLTGKEKFEVYLHQSYGPQNFILPAAQAGFFMMEPPRSLPRQWKDGGGAFGRWYAEQLTAGAANRSAQVLAQVALHEDPRYVPAASSNTAARILHALAFTFVEKTDAGGNTFAVSNFAGAAAGGFMGMAFLPPGYNTVRRAEQRSLRGVGSIALRNVAAEFRPEWQPILQKIQIPKILPEWWTHL